MEYAALDSWLGDGFPATSAATVRASRGISGLGAAASGDVWSPAPRLGEKVDFRKVQGEISRAQTIARPTADTTLALRLAVAGQYTADLLPPAEKFYLGGGRFNRGYYYGQVSGDSAVSVSAELQLNTPVPLPDFAPFDLQAQFYLFYDWGQAFQNARQESDAMLRSWGGGVRLYAGESLEVSFEGVGRLNRYPNGRGPDISPLEAAAFYWQVLWRF